VTSLLTWFMNRFRPRNGWLSLLLTLTALLCLPASLSVQGDSDEAVGLFLLAILALILGLRLARSRLSATSAAMLGGLLGLLLMVIVVARVLPPLALLWNEVATSFDWLKARFQGEPAMPLPFSIAAGFVWQRLSTFGTRIWWWAQAVAGDVPSQDPIVRQLLTAALVWATAFTATWKVYRRQAALLGLAPVVAIIAVAAFFSGGMALFYLVVALFCAVWLAAACRLWTQTARWDQQGTDYPDGLGLELVLSYGPWLAIILLVAAFFPVIYPHNIHRAFWEVAEEPWERAVRLAERFVGPIEDGYPASLGARPGESGELPSAHLLTSGPELGESIVLYVTTSDPPPPRLQPGEGNELTPIGPRRYWRARTFDTYTGQGWINGGLERTRLPANQAVAIAMPPGSDLFQQFQRLTPDDAQVYAANEPYLSDSPLQVWQRAADDLAFLTGEADTYTILSRAPEPTTPDLRANSPITKTLSPEIASRYLALPESIPRRVLDLAREVAGDAPTRYDRALAIERYLRAYPYTLDLPAPPAGRDLVDYFLFERQEGYCDYYASAMVVMARAMGVPARLASGYAQGTFVYEEDRWAVTEQDAHSWVEVYFEGLGWIEFEPTAGQPSLDRSGDLDAAALALPPLPPRVVRWWQRIPWALAVVAALALLLVAFIIWLWRPRPASTAAQLVGDRQVRLLRWGARLGHPLRDGQTPGEYADILGQGLRAWSRRARWQRARQSGEEVPPAVEQLTDAYVRSRYSARPLTDQEGWQVRDLWPRLRRHLWVLWLASGSRKGGKDD